MNQSEIRAWLNRTMASSLRKYAARLTTGELSGKAKQTDVAKARKMLEAEAVKYETKLTKRRRPSATETRQPVSQGGQDNLPQDPYEAGPGFTALAAGKHK